MVAPPHQAVGTKNVASDISEEATEQMDEDEAMLSYKQNFIALKQL